ncbi:LPS-assembly lipoprotein LptE [Flocculibacter collagenilyticus]|uniref:LPS-assembly lipoprotein LptE n=1 Tax=Flocculibacter collagenilyticus TaxID=2744479 RepID=UPI0018F56F53|nr:LPS assembly lipoprotein LptE [Flocculibacter collagenilyticus]
MKLSARFIIITLTCLLVVTTLNGCGFHLRGSHFLPAEMRTLYVNSTDKRSELANVVSSHLRNNNVNLLQSPTSTVTRLDLLRDRLDRRTLSLFKNGQVAEYELIYTVEYAVTVTNKEAEYFSFEVYRNYQDDPDKVLAKSRELSLVLSEMRQQAADKILRQLAAIR